MRKKIGFKFASATILTPDGEDLEPKLYKLICNFLNSMDTSSPDHSLNLTAFLVLCSYVSRNFESLDLDGFDHNYSIDEAETALGNKYLAADFIDYYAGLCTQSPSLPDLRGMEVRSADLSKTIATWSSELNASGLSLLESPEGETTATIQRILAETFASDAWGRYSGEAASYPSNAKLITKLADVKGKSVLDFTCGSGTYLATALSGEAASIAGSDINDQAVMRAKILCFFANPTKPHDIHAADALSAASATTPVQRVLGAPPLGMKLQESGIQEKGYCTDVLRSIMESDLADISSMEDFCIAKAIDSLTDDGIAVMHVSNSFLFHQQSSRQAIRRAIVEKGFLRAVIELPGGCMPGTAVKSALLVMAKKPSSESVLIINFDSKEVVDKGYVEKSRGRCEITDAGIEWLAETIQHRSEVSLVSIAADRTEIIQSDSNLCYSVYGDVVDYDAVLAKIRATKDITNDIKAAQVSVDALNDQIVGILASIEKEGR